MITFLNEEVYETITSVTEVTVTSEALIDVLEAFKDFLRASGYDDNIVSNIYLLTDEEWEIVQKEMERKYETNI